MNVEHCLTTLCHVDGSFLFKRAVDRVGIDEHRISEYLAMEVDRKQLLTELRNLFDMVDKLK